MLASYDDRDALKDRKMADVVLGHSPSKSERKYAPLRLEVASSGSPHDIGKIVQGLCSVGPGFAMPPRLWLTSLAR